nr:MAG TPA: hypothetical protein [Bacteriophage sp.]
MFEIKDKLITVESLKAAYDALLASISLQTLGVTVTAEELNKLGGITENVQDKINVLCEDIESVSDTATSALDLAKGLDDSKLSMKTMVVTLPAADWVDGKITVSVDGMPADAVSNVVIPSPVVEHTEIFGDAVIRCIEQNQDELVFTAEYPPSVDIDVNIILFEQKEVVA